GAYLRDGNDGETFDMLVEAELGRPASDLNGSYDHCIGTPQRIDFDGPAQDYDSHIPFPYTPATLFNEPEKYAQVLIWYFAGRPRRVTKALRIPLQPTPTGSVAGGALTNQLTSTARSEAP